MANINEFYKKYHRLTKILVIIVIVGIHLALVNKLMTYGFNQKEKAKLLEIHTKAEAFIAEDINSKCFLVFTKVIHLRIDDYLKPLGINYDLVEKKLLQIGDLIFSEIIFKTYGEDPSKVYFENEGYMVTHAKSMKCYGII